MTPDTEIMNLLNAARAKAIQELQDDRGGKAPATPENLEALGYLIRVALLCQAEEGLWAKWGVTTFQDFWGLRVEVTLNRGLAGPAILVREDFSRTKLPMLQVK